MGKSSGGGKAVHSGTDYQNRFAGWIAVRILAQHDAALPFDLPADVTLESLRCETDQPVDDTLAQTSSGGILFFQAKHTIVLQKKQNSELASVIDQFVRQYLIARDSAPSALPSGRMLDPHRDRFVLVTSSESSNPMRLDLPAFLRCLRDLTPHRKAETLDSAASNASENHAYRVIRDHVVRSWRAATGSAPEDGEIGAVLELVHALVLDLDPGETHEREARSILRASILENPAEADAAWGFLTSACALRAKAGSGIDRPGLQQLFIDASYNLKAIRSFRPDIERLHAYSQTIFGRFASRATIDVGITKVKIARPCTAALVAAVPDAALIIVGEPGAGKSIAIHESAQSLKQSGYDVVYFAADALAAESLGELRSELKLDHEFVEVLKNWPGTACGFLVIDALDAARSDGSARTLRDLIEAVMRSGGRWRVIASIREFDLRYSAELQQFFGGQPIQPFGHPEFGAVRHLLIARLQDEELDQVRSQAPKLGGLVDGTDEKLRQLLRVAFNLRLMGDLLGEGVPVADLTSIQTQIQLFDRYWQHRVIRSDHLGDAREAVLRLASEAMVAGRSLRAKRSAVTRSPADSQPLNDVLSSAVLVEWHSPGRARPDRDFLAYSHHILHDYAIARLLLRGGAVDLIRRLREEPDLAMSIRPSLVMHYQHLWSLDANHEEFWDLTVQVQHNAEVPEIAKTIGPAVATELLDSPSDFGPILAELGVPHGD